MKAAKRRGKSKHIEEVHKPRGFDRGLDIDRILAAANIGKTPLTLQFLVRWIGCDELDLVPAVEMNAREPELVIAYYESISPINRKFDEKEKERMAMALRPVIVSKVEKMMHSEAVSNEELFRAVVEEAIETEHPQFPNDGTGQAVRLVVQEDESAMVQIPQSYNTDMSMLVQDADMNWVVQEEQIV